MLSLNATWIFFLLNIKNQSVAGNVIQLNKISLNQTVAFHLPAVYLLKMITYKQLYSPPTYRKNCRF